MMDSLNGAPVAQDVEVVAKAKRRTYTLEYKREIVAKADKCGGRSGEIGALLRREGLYSSLLTTWRAARERGELAGATPKKRGPKAAPVNPLSGRVAELERQLARATKRAERAEALVEVQKKVSMLLGIIQPESDERRS
jgi:transposase